MSGLCIGAAMFVFLTASVGTSPAFSASKHVHGLKMGLASVGGRLGWSERHGPFPSSEASGADMHLARHTHMPMDLVRAKEAITWLAGSAGKVQSLVATVLRAPAQSTSSALHQYMTRAAHARSAFKKQVIYDIGPGRQDQPAGAPQRAAAAAASQGDDAALILQNSAIFPSAGPNSTTPPSLPDSLRPLRIAQYSNVYGPVLLWSTNSSSLTCSVSCISAGAFGDARAAHTADVVIINLLHPDTPWDRPPGQVWVGSYFEAPDHYPALRTAAILSQFNYTIGFRPDDDFPVFSMPYDTFRDWNATFGLPMPSLAQKSQRQLLSAWISNCFMEQSGRTALMVDLQAHGISVASYGRCQQNVPPNSTRAISPEWQAFAAQGPRQEKIALSAQHAFYLAAENSKCAYYNTEKVYQGLLSGSVPVYVGNAASLKPIVPAGSVIYADDFGSPAELAGFLKELVNNQTAYDTYQGWRRNPGTLRTLHDVLQLPEWEASHPQERACAVCEFLHAAPKRLHPEPSRDLCKFRSRARQ